MSHDSHQSQPGYSSFQVLCDGCGECAYRSENLATAIGHIDLSTFTRAWRRAGRRQLEGLPDMAMAERPLFDVLAAIQVKLENFGVPIGVLPGSPDCPVVVDRPAEPIARTASQCEPVSEYDCCQHCTHPSWDDPLTAWRSRPTFPMRDHPTMPSPVRAVRTGLRLCRKLGMTDVQAADAIWSAAMIVRARARIDGIAGTPWLDAIIACAELAAPGQRVPRCPLAKNEPRCQDCPYWPLCLRASAEAWNHTGNAPADWRTQVSEARRNHGA